MAKKQLPPKRRVFNLLKPYIAPPSGWDRVYEWLVGRARLVMVVVEILVVITFVSKVVVDTQAKALEDSIKVQDFQLRRFATSAEPALKSLQQRASGYVELWNNSSSYSGVLREINTYIPNPGASLAISVFNQEISITGADSFETLAQIEAAMKKSATFSNVRVTQLTTDSTVNPAAGGGGSYVLIATVAKVNNRPLIQ